MPPISTIKNSLQSVVKKDRLLNAVFAGGKSFLVSLTRTLYALWLQTTGLMFVFFTLAGVGALIRQYHKDAFADHKRVTVEIIFTLICFWFTLVSFSRAKRTQTRK